MSHLMSKRVGRVSKIIEGRIARRNETGKACFVISTNTDAFITVGQWNENRREGRATHMEKVLVRRSARH